MTTPSQIINFAWTLPNASTINYDQNSQFFNFINTEKQFYLKFYPKGAVSKLDDYAAIYLFRNRSSIEDDLKVFYKISLLNQTGDKCLTKQFKAEFKSQDIFYPLHGGIYIIKRDYLFDEANGVFNGNEIKIHLEMELLDQNYYTSKSIKQTCQANREEISTQMATLFENEKFSDISFVFDGHELKAHKNILAARSVVFAAMFDDDFEANVRIRIPVHDVSVNTFKELLRFIYSGNCLLTTQNATDILIAADIYQLMSLKDYCQEFLCSNLSVDTVCNVLRLVNDHNAAKLKAECLDYITKHSIEVIATVGWTALPREIIIELYAANAHFAQGLLNHEN